MQKEESEEEKEKGINNAVCFMMLRVKLLLFFSRFPCKHTLLLHRGSTLHIRGHWVLHAENATVINM